MDVVAEAQEILLLHHVPTQALLPQVEAALRGAPVAVQAPARALCVLVRDHMFKEETFLFPSLPALVRGDSAAVHHLLGPLAQMHHEHRQIEALEAELRPRLPALGPAGEPLRALLDDLAIHAHREDQGLFKEILSQVSGVPVAEVDLDELIAGGRAGAVAEEAVAEEAAAEAPAASASASPRPPPCRGRLRRVLDHLRGR